MKFEVILRYFHIVENKAKTFLSSLKLLRTVGGGLGTGEESKCLMKCGNKIEKQKLNEAEFVLKFYFAISRFVLLFLVGFCLVRKLPAICVGWLSAILASLLFSFYVCLILFLLALAFSRLQLNVKIRNNYFSIPLVLAENNSSKEICNL